MTRTARTLAFDLEATPKSEPPDFDDPGGKWDIFAVSLSVSLDTPPEDPETAVFVRRDGSDHALRQLLCAVANWAGDRRPHDAILSFNGTSFDFPILAEATADFDASLKRHIHGALDADHRDLFCEIRENQPPEEKWQSLDEALETRGIESATTKLDGEIVDGALMPTIGERILRGESLGEYEEHALRKYAASDVTPLHGLASALDEERAAVEVPR